VAAEPPGPVEQGRSERERRRAHDVERQTGRERLATTRVTWKERLRCSDRNKPGSAEWRNGSGGRIVDIALERGAVFVITAIAGSFAAFFRSGDSIS